ncbi:unnamed protein product [Sphenostylis stenocarpa]|uniref:Uncharacterized protein n=1 Tax=Sphenostylis stenocarpa TaxID=92480 RepID=A0AA86W0L0_9FABA|nr:unnamed protein product [Sphenostylis stenocarpa]
MVSVIHDHDKLHLSVCRVRMMDKQRRLMNPCGSKSLVNEIRRIHFGEKQPERENSSPALTTVLPDSWSEEFSQELLIIHFMEEKLADLKTAGHLIQ